jgi:hypothetical protein
VVHRNVDIVLHHGVVIQKTSTCIGIVDLLHILLSHYDFDITNCMEQCCSSEANNHSASQEIPCHL